MSRRQLRQAFIVTIAVAAAGACNPSVSAFSECPAERPALGEACGSPGDSCDYGDDGCGSTITATCGDDGVWSVGTGSSCNPPFPDPPPVEPCPASSPGQGEYCASNGQYCDYYEGDFCEEWIAEATCVDNAWDVVEYYGSGECNPPPAECPIDMPREGSECPYDPDSWDGWPSYCSWETATPCGDAWVDGHCAANEAGTMVWELALNVACQAPEGQCGAYDSVTGCRDDATCQWLTPSCDDGPNNVTAGCYAKADCASSADACGDWGTCAKVSYDPCYDAACQACSADIDVCLPNATP